MAKMIFYDKDKNVLCEKDIVNMMSSKKKKTLMHFSISDSEGNEVFSSDAEPCTDDGVQKYKITWDENAI